MDTIETLGGELFYKHTIYAFFFAMAVYIVSSIIRKIIEISDPKLKDTKFVSSRIWRELILPILPVVIGAILAIIITKFPYPNAFSESIILKITYGMIIGFFSTWAYRIIKTIVQRKWNVELDEK